MNIITSRQHPLCKLTRVLHDGKARRKHSLSVAEGSNAVGAATSANWPMHALLCSPDFADKNASLLHAASTEVHLVVDEVLASISDSRTSPGVIALCEMPPLLPDNWRAPDDLLLVLDGVSDPGNVGTLIRAGDAVGAGAVVLSEHSADAWSPKSVRASAGSVFHLPPLQLAQRAPSELSAWLQDQKIPVVAAVARDGQSCFKFEWPRRCALILGHETRGISPELEARAQRVTIPMFGRAESLNVAMAGTVLLFAWRQAQQNGAI